MLFVPSGSQALGATLDEHGNESTACFLFFLQAHGNSVGRSLFKFDLLGLQGKVAMKQVVFLKLCNLELESRVSLLKGLYDEAYELAAAEDRNKASLIIAPMSSFVEVKL